MKKTILACCLALSSGLTSFASTILSDSFTYPDGDIAAAAGSPWLIHSGTTPANIAANELRLTGGNSADVNALLSGNPYLSNSPAVLYSALKMRVTSQPGNAGTYFAHFKDTNTGAATGFGARIFVSASNAYTATLITNNQIYRVGIANGASATAASGQIDQDLFLNTNYIVVTRFVPNTGVSTIWLNPTAESDPSVTATDAGTATRPNPIDVVAYAFRQASGIGVVVVDNLKVGTAFGDVAGNNVPPSISGIPNQHIAVNASTPALPFTVSDVETPATSLTVTGASSAISIVSNANIVISGTGTNRSVTIDSAGGQQGVATITLTVSDADGAVSSTSFQVSVGVPTISDVPNQATPTNTTLGPVAFTVGDTETAADSLIVTATSDNSAVLPNSGIVLGGAGADRTLTLTPATDQAGLATVTITVSDGASTAIDTFILTAYPLLGLVRSDDFNRPDGSLVTGNGEWLSNGGTGGAHLGELRIADGQIVVTEDGSEDVTTELPPGSAPVYSTTSGTILYVSLKVNCTNLPTSGGSYVTHFKANGFDTLNFRGRLFAATAGAASGKFRLGVANNAANISAGGLLQTDLSLNHDYLVVLRYNVGVGETRLWIDPASESSAAVNAIDTPSPIGIGAFTFRQNAGIGTILVDDLKIGTAFSDVVAPSYTLTITASGADVQISWPVAAAGYNLQFADELPGTWMDSTDPVSVEGDQNVVRYTATTGHKFFQLKKP